MRAAVGCVKAALTVLFSSHSTAAVFPVPTRFVLGHLVPEHVSVALILKSCRSVMSYDLRRPCAESRLPAPARPDTAPPETSEASELREYLHDFIVVVCLDIREICGQDVECVTALVFSRVV